MKNQQDYKIKQSEKGKNFLNLFRKDCEMDKLLGFEFEVIKPGTITYHFTVEERHLSSPGICHGGIISALMDASLGMAALSRAAEEDKVCSTVEFKTNFIAPARLGDKIIAHAELDFQGKNLMVSSCSIYKDSDKETKETVAKGIGTFNLYPMDKRVSVNSSGIYEYKKNSTESD